MVVITIMLFIIGFYIGKDVEKEEEKAELKRQKEEQYTEVYSPSDSPKNLEDSEDEHEHENYEYENPEVDKEEVPTTQSSTLADYFTKEEIEASKKVAEDFIEAYYPFNGDKPLENLENAKEYMSERLFEEYRSSVPRPTQSVHSKEIISLEAYEPYDPSENYLEWNVRVVGEVFDSNGELNKEETYDYTLKITKVNETFKVQDISLNLTN